VQCAGQPIAQRKRGDAWRGNDRIPDAIARGANVGEVWHGCIGL